MISNIEHSEISITESDRTQYYFHKIFPLLFSFLFLGISLSGLIAPESMTVSHNGEVVETNFTNLLPFIIIGLMFFLIFIWLTQNYFRVKANKKDITILKRSVNSAYSWNEIEYVHGLRWPMMGDLIFKLKPKQGKSIYFLADKLSFSFKDLFDTKFRTKMSMLIWEVKRKYKI